MAWTHMLFSTTAPCEPKAFNKLRHSTGECTGIYCLFYVHPQPRYVLIFSIETVIDACVSFWNKIQSLPPSHETRSLRNSSRNVLRHCSNPRLLIQHYSRFRKIGFFVELGLRIRRLKNRLRIISGRAGFSLFVAVFLISKCGWSTTHCEVISNHARVESDFRLLA